MADSREEGEQQNKVMELFDSLGLKVYIWGCGCCESPHAKIEYKGEIVVDAGDFNMDLHLAPAG